MNTPTDAPPKTRQSSVQHAAARYRAMAGRLKLEAWAEKDARKRRALVQRMEQLVRLAVDLEKKAGGGDE